MPGDGLDHSDQSQCFVSSSSCGYFRFWLQIRDLAADILLQYFPWPLAGLTSSDTLCQWMESSLVMCNSAKAHECQGGALVLKMVFVK